jgi:AraC-like DNA-binding protein
VSTDTLSDVLRAVRLTGAVFFDLELCAPWVVAAPAARDVAKHVLPGAEHVIEYHLVVSGNAYAGIPGETQVPVETGDLVIFPQGDPHVFSSQRGMVAEPDLNFHQRVPGARLPLVLHQQGDGERVALICGFIGCDREPYNPLLATLPRTLILRREQLALRPVAPLIAVAVAETKAQRSGGECVLSRLSELLFVEAVRLYVEGLSNDANGWLAGLRDPQIGQALALLHGKPASSWSLEDLASEVGMSRSLLAERFVHFVGLPPMQYLAQWRMQLAAERLRSTNDTLAAIADRVGYGSESAFSRAFKRLVGVAPASFRQGMVSTSGGGDSRSAR